VFVGEVGGDLEASVLAVDDDDDLVFVFEVDDGPATTLL